MTIQVDPRTGRVRVEVAGALDADELLDLLKALSAARAQIARDPPRPGDVWVAPKASVHTQLMGGNAGPDSLLALLFPGIGWIGATLAPAVRAQLIGLLATQQATVVSAPANPPAPAPAPMPIGPERDGNSTLH